MHIVDKAFADLASRIGDAARRAADHGGRRSETAVMHGHRAMNRRLDREARAHGDETRGLDREAQRRTLARALVNRRLDAEIAIASGLRSRDPEFATAVAALRRPSQAIFYDEA